MLGGRFAIVGDQQGFMQFQAMYVCQYLLAINL